MCAQTRSASNGDSGSGAGPADPTGDPVPENQPTDSIGEISAWYFASRSIWLIHISNTFFQADDNIKQDGPNENAQGDEDAKSGNGLSTGAIAGIVAGGIVLLGAFAFGIWWAGKQGARKGAAAAAAAIYAQQRQEKPQFYVEESSYSGTNPTYQPPSVPQPLSHSHIEVVSGQPEIEAVHGINPQQPSQWAYEVDGHNPQTQPKNYSEMESR